MSTSTQKAFNVALAAFQGGNLAEAERQFKNVLQHDPKNLASLNLLAAILTQRKMYEEAEQFFKLALHINPTSDATLYNYGIALKALNRPIEALDKFSQALMINPLVSETWNNRGTVLNDLRRCKEAISDFDKAVTLKQNYTDAFYNKGNAHKALGQYEEALASYEKALTINPDLPEAWLGRAIVHGELRQLNQSFAAFDKALSLKIDFAEALAYRGCLLTDLERYDEAWECIRKALALNPNLAEAWHGYGSLLGEIKRHREALGATDRALSLRPDFIPALVKRAETCRALKEYDEALGAAKKALDVDPDSAEAWTELGIHFGELRHYTEAFAAFEKALSLNPKHIRARFHDGSFRLLLGDTERGWNGYESRLDNPRKQRNFSRPMWRGDGPLENKTILVHAEQGLGDTLMACRYVPMVAALGAKVIFEVQQPLRGIMESLQGVWKLISNGEQIPHFDVHCPAMSLPMAFKTRMDSIPEHVPYLAAPKEKVKKWRARLGDEPFKIGIGWAGNPAFRYDFDRSILLKNILPICDVAGARFFSIQKELRESDAEVLSANPDIVHLGNELNDFQDTAAVMESLDLVICSDTSIVNLAGALGRPVWVLLSSNPDWRWLLDRTDSPWYPSARLFRQTKNGDWSSVVTEVRAELERLFASGHC